MVRISTYLRLGTYLLAAIGVLSCDSGSTDSTTSNPSMQVEGAEVIGWSGTYHVSGGRIVFDYGSDTVELRAWCDADDPFLRKVDSHVSSRYDTFDILVQNDSLALLKRLEGGSDDAESYGRLFVRERGTSKGVEGVWTLASHITLPVGGKPVVDSFWGEVGPQTGSVWTLTLAAGTFRNLETATLDWAEYFVRDWGEGILRLPGKGDAVEAVRVDASVVRLTGRSTGEIVTVRRLGRHPFRLYGGDWQYSSSDPAHNAFIQGELPTSCPDLPEWFRTFQAANSSPVVSARRIVSTDSGPSSAIFPRGAASGRGEDRRR